MQFAEHYDTGFVSLVYIFHGMKVKPIIKKISLWCTPILKATSSNCSTSFLFSEDALTSRGRNDPGQDNQVQDRSFFEGKSHPPQREDDQHQKRLNDPVSQRSHMMPIIKRY
jgi:hypothetical protein